MGKLIKGVLMVIFFPIWFCFWFLLARWWLCAVRRIKFISPVVGEAISHYGGNEEYIYEEEQYYAVCYCVTCCYVHMSVPGCLQGRH